MRIGILTFHRAYNYGAFLQALALKIVLEQRRHIVSFIDYQDSAHTQSYALIDRNLFQGLGIRGKISLIVKGILKAPRQWKRYSKMRKLQRKYLGLTGHPKSRLDETQDVNLDLIVYGSDQIWRKAGINHHLEFDPAYWGEGFEGIRKITYAASMGIIDLSYNDKKFISDHLKLYSNISCREENLLRELTPLTSQKIHHVLDPVFLLSKNNWEKLLKAEGSHVIKRKYVLVYNLMHSKEVDKLAQRIASERGLEVIEISGAVQPYIFDKNNLQTKDAFEFLNYIRNAKFVVASSFHAIAFSVIFNVNFYAVGMNNNSERVRSLLAISGLGDRLVSDSNLKKIEDVDYSNMNLYPDIEASKAYLNSAI